MRRTGIGLAIRGPPLHQPWALCSGGWGGKHSGLSASPACGRLAAQRSPSSVPGDRGANCGATRAAAAGGGAGSRRGGVGATQCKLAPGAALCMGPLHPSSPKHTWRGRRTGRSGADACGGGGLQGGAVQADAGSEHSRAAVPASGLKQAQPAAPDGACSRLPPASPPGSAFFTNCCSSGAAAASAASACIALARATASRSAAAASSSSGAGAASPGRNWQGGRGGRGRQAVGVGDNERKACASHQLEGERRWQAPGGDAGCGCRSAAQMSGPPAARAARAPPRPTPRLACSRRPGPPPAFWVEGDGRAGRVKAQMA